MKIQVKDSYTGETGFIDDSELSARYQPVEAQQAQQPTQQPVAQPQVQQQAQTKQPQQTDPNVLNKILGFLAPRTQAIGQDIKASGQVPGFVQSTGQNTQDLISNALNLRKANQSGNTQQAQQLAQQGRNISGQPKTVAPQFSQDINKSYLKRGAQTGLELGSYLAPAGKTLKSAVGLGAVSGGLKSLSDDQNVVGGAVGGGIGAGVMFGLFDLGGKLLNSTGKKLTLKGLRPSKTQITKFGKKTGEELTDFVQKNKLFEKGSTQANSKLKKLYSQYDDAAIKSGKTIKVPKLLQKFQDQIDELSKFGGTDFDSMINYLTKEKAAVARKLAGQADVGVDWITNNRRMLDKVVPKGAFGADPITAGGKKIVRDIYKETIDTATGGVTGKIGSQIKNFEAFKDIAELQGNLGKGNLPVGLLSLLSAGAGGGLGYGSGGKEGAVKGALFAYGLTSIANNPKVVSALTKILTSGGTKVGSAAGNIVPQTVGRVAGQKASGLVGNILQGSPSQLKEDDVSQQQPQDNQGTNIIPTQQQTQQPVQQQNYITGNSPEQHYQAMQRALQAGDKKGAAQIRQAFEDETKYQKGQGGTAKALSSTQTKEVNLAKSGIRGLNTTEEILGLRDAQGNKIKGAEINMDVLTKQALIPGKLGSRAYDNATFTTAEAILRARSGAAVPETEVKRYTTKFFPQIGDSQKVVRQKITELRNILNDMVNQQGAGNEADILQSILSPQ